MHSQAAAALCKHLAGVAGLPGRVMHQAAIQVRRGPLKRLLSLSTVESMDQQDMRVPQELVEQIYHGGSQVRLYGPGDDGCELVVQGTVHLRDIFGRKTDELLRSFRPQACAIEQCPARFQGLVTCRSAEIGPDSTDQLTLEALRPYRPDHLAMDRFERLTFRGSPRAPQPMAIVNGGTRTGAGAGPTMFDRMLWKDNKGGMEFVAAARGRRELGYEIILADVDDVKIRESVVHMASKGRPAAEWIHESRRFTTCLISEGWLDKTKDDINPDVFIRQYTVSALYNPTAHDVTDLRDKYMSSAISLYSRLHPSCKRMVLICGIGHVPGIVHTLTTSHGWTWDSST